MIVATPWISVIQTAHYYRTQGRERIGGLGTQPLQITRPPIAGADIIADGDAKDMLWCIGGTDIAGFAANDNDHFTFVMNAGTVRWQHNGLVGPITAEGRFANSFGWAPPLMPAWLR